MSIGTATPVSRGAPAGMLATLRGMPARPDDATLELRDALARSEPLMRLTQRLRESQQRFDCIAPLLPPPLRARVQAGPVDEQGWALLAANGAVAAKLRQLLPALQARLADAGWPALALRVRVFNGG